ncbi:MAG: DUF4834 family protein [Prevotellaceae bacterium]|jgi:hypothetical protein|nr:DUF4834 family protein [Prevotellaceae bacterium]
MKYILIAILIITLISWIFRAITSYFTQNFLGNMDNNQARKNTKTHKYGDVNVENKPRNKKIKKTVGEYVDYEEIK